MARLMYSLLLLVLAATPLYGDVKQGGEKAGDDVEVNGTYTKPTKEPVTEQRVAIEGTNDDGKPEATETPRDKVSVAQEPSTGVPKYNVEPEWQPLFCKTAGVVCNAEQMKDYPMPQITEDVDECLLMCVKTVGCRGFTVEPSSKQFKCTLYKGRCNKTEGMTAKTGATFYYRLSKTEEKVADCPANIGECGNCGVLTQVKKLQNSYCFNTDQYCPAQQLVDVTGYYKGPITRPTFVSCSQYCSANPSCEGANWDASTTMCTLLGARCVDAGLKPATNGSYYLSRLHAANPSNEKCSGKQQPLVILPPEWSAYYCMSEHNYCNGNNLLPSPNVLTQAKCLAKCNSDQRCQSCAYWKKPAKDPKDDGIDQCELKSIRCNYTDLVNMPGRREFFRLRMEEKDCPVTRIPGKPSTNFRGEFCKASNMVCKGTELPKMPADCGALNQCLTLCVKTEDCQSASYTIRSGGNGTCSLKQTRCNYAQLNPQPGTDDFYRLLEGEDCPSGQPADDGNWDARFCFVPQKDCPGTPMEQFKADTYQKCLTACVFKSGCRGVVYTSEGQCILKSRLCEAKDLTDNPKYYYYSRLNFGDNCADYAVPKVPTCPANSEYRDKSPGCPKSCRRLATNDCKIPDNPGCVCKAGYVNNDASECIPSETCSCFDEDNNPRQIGASWRSDDCTITYKCVLNTATKEPRIETTQTPCPEHSHCVSKSSESTCVCDEGYPEASSNPLVCKPWKDCPVNSKYNAQASDAQPSCTNLAPESCGTKIFACECTKPCEVWDSDFANQCVHASTCGCKDDNGKHRELNEEWMEAGCEKKICKVTGDECYAKPISVHKGCGNLEVCDVGKTESFCRCQDHYHYQNNVCVPDCPPNSFWNDNGSACESTCDTGVNNEATCGTYNTPHCECNTCFVKSGDACIHASMCTQCVLADRKTKKKVGDSWKSANCDIQYNCIGGNGGSDLATCAPHVTQDAYKCPGFKSICKNGECGCPDDREMQPNGDCNLKCPSNSVYVRSGARCDDTCSKKSDAACTITGEMCKCNACYVKSGSGPTDTCLPASTCQTCFLEDGSTKQVGDSWKSANCDIQYNCIGGSSGSDLATCAPHVTQDAYKCPGFESTCKNGVCGCPDGRVMQANGDCYLKCPQGTHRVSSAPPCEDTCEKPSASQTCGLPNEERCVCDDNKIRDANGNCVTAEQCGCIFNGKHYNVGQSYIGEDCDSKHECVIVNGRPVIKQVYYHCPVNSYCCTEEGTPKCICKDGYEMQEDQTCKDCPNQLRIGPIAIIVHSSSKIKLPMTPEGDCYPMSTYNHQATACPNTCFNPKASVACPHDPEPGCVCHKNHLFDHILDRCIPHDECGCYDSANVPRSVGSAWFNSQCTTMYSCAVGKHGPKIESMPYQCQAHSSCRNSSDGYRCKCDPGFVETSSDSCVAATPK